MTNEEINVRHILNWATLATCLDPPNDLYPLAECLDPPNDLYPLAECLDPPNDLYPIAECLDPPQLGRPIRFVPVLSSILQFIRRSSECRLQLHCVSRSFSTSRKNKSRCSYSRYGLLLSLA